MVSEYLSIFSIWLSTSLSFQNQLLPSFRSWDGHKLTTIVTQSRSESMSIEGQATGSNLSLHLGLAKRP